MKAFAAASIALLSFVSITAKAAETPATNLSTFDENKAPLSNLFVTLLDRMGTGAESVKNSNGALTELLKG